MGGVGSIVAILFGIVWTITAASMGAPVFFPIFGVLFVVLGIVQAVYHFKNATGKNRYSAFDITDEREEPDPLNSRFADDSRQEPARSERPATGNFCPYCGSPMQPDHIFCKQCGKKIS